MMRAGLTLVTAIVLGLAESAAAADLPQRPAAAPVFSPTAVYNWTGIYFGLNGGGGWGHQDPLNVITNRFDDASLKFSGGVAGGTAGAQIQSGHVVLGFEVDLDWAGLKGSATYTPAILGVPVGGAINATTKIDWEATARGRVGYANDNWLFYATGGLALLGAKTTFNPLLGTSCGTFGIINCSGTDKQVGAVLGGGVEYGITQNVSAKLEYLYFTAASLDISHHSEVRAGLNYRFGGL
ncbi:MAG TPA: outer membrane beta-barrel protein [Pseudolabrys sp.]|jgi:outer membrane immunogenic protein|nr:outer membrane beta-barrel protein [Verrucomicrobiae bacterium]HUL88821.1 outer membrane beta-barrel protein [Pseudolabrys sp.]